MYIDFECRQKQLPTLLGMLGAGDATPEAFEQWILDPALASARVARKGTRVDQLANVAERLADEAERHDQQMVGWSFFDRNRLVQHPGVSPKAVRVVTERYANAIPVAKEWRRAYLPDWKPAANDLKSYFEPTGFKTRLPPTVDPTPADWIEHVQDQIASRGTYKDVTRQTKRDWNYLLIYNEDDCGGLKHVFDTATRELALWKAYTETTFRVDMTPNPIDISVGWRRKSLDKVLQAHRAKTWAFVTSWNPGSRPLSAAKNQRRHRSLIDEVERAGLAWLPGRGIGNDDQWPAEESLFIPGCSNTKALAYQVGPSPRDV